MHKSIPERSAYNEYRDLTMYREFLSIEKNPDFKRILKELIEHEEKDYALWLEISAVKKFSVSRPKRFAYRTMRRILGLTFTAKFLERHERRKLAQYREFLARNRQPEHVRRRIENIISHGLDYEQNLISQIKEEQVEFTSSIILGLNDGLIELTGALTGFSFAFAKHEIVALGGFIMGVAAALSMASSAYMQARHEKGKDPRKAGIYTGISYLLVVLLLIAPYLFIVKVGTAVAVMGVIALSIIAGVSYYTSVLFGRRFRLQFGEMFIFSVGVAAIAFVIGIFFKRLTGIAI